MKISFYVRPTALATRKRRKRSEERGKMRRELWRFSNRL